MIWLPNIEAPPQAPNTGSTISRGRVTFTITLAIRLQLEQPTAYREKAIWPRRVCDCPTVATLWSNANGLDLAGAVDA